MVHDPFPSFPTNQVKPKLILDPIISLLISHLSTYRPCFAALVHRTLTMLYNIYYAIIGDKKAFLVQLNGDESVSVLKTRLKQ